MALTAGGLKGGLKYQVAQRAPGAAGGAVDVHAGELILMPELSDESGQS